MLLIIIYKTLNKLTMKKSIFLFLAAIALTSAAFAQSEKYVAAMKKNLQLFDAAKTPEDYMAMVNTFERIGDAEKTQWAPYYYAALALSTAGWLPQITDKDANAEKMLAFCTKAEALASDNIARSEIETVRNMASTQQMMVNPEARWATYGKAAGDALQKAITLNANNPRAYYLQGMSMMGTPVAFGGGKDKAKPLFEKAIELYKAEKPATLYPDWGKKQADEALAQCQ
jgi:hypothetical protein